MKLKSLYNLMFTQSKNFPAFACDRMFVHFCPLPNSVFQQLISVLTFTSPLLLEDQLQYVFGTPYDAVLVHWYTKQSMEIQFHFCRVDFQQNDLSATELCKFSNNSWCRMFVTGWISHFHSCFTSYYVYKADNIFMSSKYFVLEFKVKQSLRKVVRLPALSSGRL